ncbi:MAG: hypothetical protein EOO65_01925 [Methanosarcinales archaeon]|nr:MAG: hypothetical protein EOO65_01925 [Methanosarcinales archaeon]
MLPLMRMPPAWYAGWPPRKVVSGRSTEPAPGRPPGGEV